MTVYRSLPYQNNRKKTEQAAPHADTLGHGKHVLNVTNSRSVLVNDIISLIYTLRLLIKILDLQMTEKFQRSIGSKFSQEGDILLKFFKISKFSKTDKIKKETRRENKVKRSREGACSTSYSSGNQVDGLPLAAILTRGEIAWTCNRANLCTGTSGLKFN